MLGLALVSCGGTRAPEPSTAAIVIPAPPEAGAPDAALHVCVDDSASIPRAMAQTLFAHAEDLVAERCIDEARRVFASVMRFFPYSRYAALAALRIADLDFDRGDYASAADEYAAFAHDHRAHERAAAASKRAATARCLIADAGGCKDDYDGGV
jgi:TolA-binding protein